MSDVRVRATLFLMKTNAARLLDRLGVQYELREYEADPEALDAQTVAAQIGLRRNKYSRR